VISGTIFWDVMLRSPVVFSISELFNITLIANVSLQKLKRRRGYFRRLFQQADGLFWGFAIFRHHIRTEWSPKYFCK
jgi:hypothetical protein